MLHSALFSHCRHYIEEVEGLPIDCTGFGADDGAE